MRAIDAKLILSAPGQFDQDPEFDLVEECVELGIRTALARWRVSLVERRAVGAVAAFVAEQAAARM